jgi:5-methylcytosine-specific restriction enzyme A
MTRNPKWTRDEMILALDLYHRVNPQRVTSSDPEIRRLSQQLRSFAFHPVRTRANTFRNPTGILMTLRTFMRYDVACGSKGLRGGKLGHELWMEFNERRIELHQLARAIVSAAKALNHAESAGTATELFEEGGVLFRIHRLRERNRRLVALKKAQALSETGLLACEACGFDFAATYGRLGEGYIECHHRRPLSDLLARVAVRVEDLALVCGNCHRILHRQNPMITVDQLRDFLHRS